MYSIRRIDRLQAEDIEYLGTKRKFWFTLEGRRWLFKAEERGTGEDWAEKVVCELARLLGLPCVPYELAHEHEGERAVQPGVICPSFTPGGLALVMGNQLLVRQQPGYPGDDRDKYRVRQHTVGAVAAAVADLSPPAPEWTTGLPEGVGDAIGIFTGYVMLDAWVANQDRHHQNWGAIRQGPQLRLAPTYDHGSSLARNLQDDEREERLRTRDQNRSIEKFAERARSGFRGDPEDRRTLPALEVFRQFSERAPAAAGVWLERLGGVSSEAVMGILVKVPGQRMTEVTRDFTARLLGINRKRLLGG